MRKQKKVSKKHDTHTLRKQYTQLFETAPDSPQIVTPDTFEQPSPLKIVRSVTTYSAFEEPITD